VKSKHIQTIITLFLMLNLMMIFPKVSQVANAQTEPIKIGVVTSRTGAYSTYGEMEVNGLYLGIEYATNGTNKVLGRDIQILVEDDAGSSTESGSKATKLVLDDEVDFLQGSASSACASAVQAVAAEYGVVFMVAPAADESITGAGFNNYTFRTASSTWQDAFTGGPFATAYLGKTFAFLAPDYSWGYSGVDTWSYAIEKYGGQIVHVEYVPLNTVNFAPYLQRIISADPDCFIPMWSGSGAMYLFPAMSDLGIYDKMNVTSGIGDLFSLQLLGVALNFTGMTKYAYGLPNNTINDWLVNTWRDRFDSDTLPIKTAYTLPVPDLFVESSFAAGQAIVYAIEKAGDTDADDIIPALEGMSFMAPKGQEYIRPEDHQALQSMYIAQVFNDTTSWIKDYYPGGFINLRLVAEIPGNVTAPPIRGDITPPTISNVARTPLNPTIIDTVNVSATITDDLTGVKTASAYYSIDGSTWTGIPMTLLSGTKYQAQLPGQAANVTVQYYVNATDVALNTNTSATYSYKVLAYAIYLTLSVQPAEGGTTEPSVGVIGYAEGENVTVTITPASGYQMDYWELDGANVSLALTYTLSMLTNHTLTAHMKASSTGLPIEYLIATAVAIIVVVAVGVFLFIRRRRK
jgi:branched-chain amino acid transport system substrate-binding protein